MVTPNDQTPVPVAKVSTLSRVAAELEDAIDDVYRFWVRLDVADHITLIAVLGLFVSTVLPWHHTAMGLVAGGGMMWLMGAATIAILIVRERARRKARADMSAIDEAPGHAVVRRLNLLQIVVGAGTVAYLTVLVLAFYLTNPDHFDISYGWFTALGCAMGLSYSGISRFVRDVPRA